MHNLCNQRCTYYRGEGEWIRWLIDKESTDLKGRIVYFYKWNKLSELTINFYIKMEFKIISNPYLWARTMKE